MRFERTDSSLRGSLKTWSIALAFLAPLIAASGARAEEPTTDYCRKVTAQAQGDAALLFAPTVSAQAIRFPASGIANSTGTQVGKDVQPRATLGIGLVDMYKGAGVLDVAHADCAREQSAVTLRELIEARADLGRLPALEKQLDYLRRRRPDVAAMVDRADQRLAAKVGTILEVSEIRRKALEIDRKISQLEGEVALLSRRRPPALTGEVKAMLDQYDQRAVEYENRVSHVRNLQPWALNVTGGVVAQPVVDYFGVIELSYNFGGIVRNGAESRALEAREHEIKNARYELHAQVAMLLDELRESVTQMQHEVTALDAHLARLTSERASLAGVEAPNKDQVVSSLELETIALEADRTYLAVLIDQRSALGGSHATK